MTCTITGNIRSIRDDALPGAVITFSRRGVVGQGGNVVTPDPISVTADEAGAITVDLYPGNYRGQYRGSNGTTHFTVGVPDAPTAHLAALIGIADVSIPAQALADTEAARDEAIAQAALTAADRVQTGLDRAAVAADAATVVTDKGIVAGDKAIVAADKALVTADRVAADVSAAAAQVARLGAEAAFASTLALNPFDQPVDALHLTLYGTTALSIPPGWWDTGLATGFANTIRISNWLPDVTLRGAVSLFFDADVPLQLFGPDGFTPVSVPGTAISLALDEWRGLELGPQLVTGSPTLPTGWSGTGPWTKVAGVATSAGWSIGALVAGRAYLVEAVFSALTASSITPRFTGGAAVVGEARSAPGSYRQIIVATAAHTTLELLTTSTSAAVVTSVSVREVTNWPAFQGVVAARGIWGRAPTQVRNMLIQSNNFASTAWTKTNVAVTTGAIAGPFGGLADLITKTGTDGTTPAQSVAVTPGAWTFAAEVLKAPGSDWFRMRLDLGFQGGGAASAWFNLATGQVGASTGGLVGAVPEPLGAGWYLVKGTITFTGSGNTVFGLCPVDANSGFAGTGSVYLSDTQAEIGTVANARQRVGTTRQDITETGVRSFGLISLDGSDDALLMQIANGGTVAVALFGRGGSYLIPSITLAAPSLLSIGPLSVLDDGVLVSGCPLGILRAVGTVPWSSRFEIVGAAIMAANPTPEQRARVMRRFAAVGARGWFVPGANTAINGGFGADADWTKDAGWTIGGGVATKTAGTAAALEQAQTIVAGGVYLWTADITRTAGTLKPRLTGGTTFNASAISAGGALSEILIGQPGNTTLGFQGDAAFAGTIDNVTLQLLTPEF